MELGKLPAIALLKETAGVSAVFDDGTIGMSAIQQEHVYKFLQFPYNSSWQEKRNRSTDVPPPGNDRVKTVRRTNGSKC